MAACFEPLARDRIWLLADGVWPKKGFNGDGAVVAYLNNKGDNHETYGNGTSLCVRALQHLRICPHRSSQVERQDSYHV